MTYDKTNEIFGISAIKTWSIKTISFIKTFKSFLKAVSYLLMHFLSSCPTKINHKIRFKNDLQENSMWYAKIELILAINIHYASAHSTLSITRHPLECEKTMS